MKRGQIRPSALVVQQTAADWKPSNLNYAHRPKLMRAKLNGRPRSTGSGRWVDLKLVRDTRGVTDGELAFRLTLDRRVRANIFTRKGAHAPTLVVTTRPEPPAPRSRTRTRTTPDPGTPGPTNPAPSDARVFAHYFPPYPLSFDNKRPRPTTTTPSSTSLPTARTASTPRYAGLLRDRPLGRDPVAGDWWLSDMRNEVRQAKIGWPRRLHRRRPGPGGPQLGPHRRADAGRRHRGRLRDRPDAGRLVAATSTPRPRPRRRWPPSPATPPGSRSTASTSCPPSAPSACRSTGGRTSSPSSSPTRTSRPS